MKSAALTCSAVLLSALSLHAQATVMVDNGDSARRIDVVFVPQGFSATQRPAFIAACNSAINQFSIRSPFREYFPFLNFHRVTVSASEARDVDEIITLINGAGRSYAYLGGSCWVYLLYPGYPGDEVARAVIHECGHSFECMLMDEYVEPGQSGRWTYGEPTSANVTASLTTPKWEEWLIPSTPRPTPPYYIFPPNTPRIGLFEGAMFSYTQGIYRPAFDCQMKSAGATPFDEVCGQEIVRTLYRYTEIATFDTTSPAQGVVPISSPTTLFSVVPKAPTDHSLTVEWYLDSILRQSGGNSYSLNATDLVNTTHTLEAVTRDVTPRVRRDPSNLMTDRATWTVQRTVASIVVTPASVTLPTGGTRQFSAQGYDVMMRPIATTYTWSATGGTITSSGFYTAPSTAGTYTVRAAVGPVSGSATVTVQTPQLTSLVVTPPMAYVVPGFHRRFIAGGRDQFGRPFPTGPLTWSASQGSIDATGRYTAPGSTGTFTITVRSGTLSATATVKVHTSAMRGDMNGDVTLTSSDLVLLQNYVFLGTNTPAYLENADCNGDLAATSSDVVLVMNAVFLGDPLPPVTGSGTPLDEP